MREALITNMAAMVIGASLENTARTFETDGQFSLISQEEKTNMAPNKVRAVISTLTFSSKKEIKWVGRYFAAH